jgi:hypothetical protein
VSHQCPADLHLLSSVLPPVGSQGEGLEPISYQLVSWRNWLFPALVLSACSGVVESHGSVSERAVVILVGGELLVPDCVSWHLAKLRFLRPA